MLEQPLHLLENRFKERHAWIKEWFHNQWHLTPPPIYGSIDLRNAGFKLAPIDMNLFPAGFNNLNPDFLHLSVAAARRVIQQISPGAKQIIIIPESHTRNPHYWDNIKTLKFILEEAAFDVRLGGIDHDQVTPLLRKADQLFLIDPTSHLEFVPDLIILNNDLSAGIPPILENIKQTLVPPAESGWSQRLKSEYFQYYSDVANEFAKQIDIDPWLIAPLFRHCGQIDFMKQDGMECLVNNAEHLFAEIEKKYVEYGISHQPFLIIKADAGTYGMAVMTVRNLAELRSLNRKQRTRMSKTKGGQSVNRVILQEGIYTFETIGEDQAVAEPVVYLWGDTVVGGFYRVHKERGVDENLNAPGMHFEPLPFCQSCNDPSQHNFYVYGVIAQLSMLAAAREINELRK